jgi:hypothetical protein
MYTVQRSGTYGMGWDQVGYPYVFRLLIFCYCCVIKYLLFQREHTKMYKDFMLPELIDQVLKTSVLGLFSRKLYWDSIGLGGF